MLWGTNSSAITGGVCKKAYCLMYFLGSNKISRNFRTSFFQGDAALRPPVRPIFPHQLAPLVCWLNLNGGGASVPPTICLMLESGRIVISVNDFPDNRTFFQARNG